MLLTAVFGANRHRRSYLIVHDKCSQFEAVQEVRNGKISNLSFILYVRELYELLSTTFFMFVEKKYRLSCRILFYGSVS